MELYIGNLPYDAGESQVRNLFSKFGGVGSIRIVENKKSGASKGYGFVTMISAQDGHAAIKGMNSQEVGGRRIVVSEARTRARRRRR
ncbi:MAG: RNA-binding protein [Lentisphaerales bacterium]|nr:MAG: RNA-binding protein [Lentisphaerales bacterium]